jgi:iron complex transport system substrate-binding protein
MFAWTLAVSLLLGVAAPRIVSLIPSLTEDLFAIGAGPQVVGASQFTDYPPAARHLPQVASFSSLDAERIVRLHPDVVVGIPSQASLVSDLRRAGLRVELLPDDSFGDIFATLGELGALSGHERQARTLEASLRARTAALERTVPTSSAPKTFVVLGVSPSIFTVGNASYIAHLLALAGGRNASTLAGAYGRYSAEALLAEQPDVIVADKQSGLAGALGLPPWNALRAVRDGRVYVLDDADILERPGPRYNEGLAWLIARLHPASAGSR